MEPEERKPKYKVGDIVTIKKREGHENDYKFGFVDEMSAMAGEKLRVTMVSYSSDTKKIYPDDGYSYHLERTMYNWASSMFEDDALVTCIPECQVDSSLEPFVRRKRCPKLDFHL